MNIAKLRTCASCEWIFSDGVECPKCLFGSYSAHFVYGKACYRYSISQKPWFDKKLQDYKIKLWQEINEAKHGMCLQTTTTNLPPIQREKHKREVYGIEELRSTGY